MDSDDAAERDQANTILVVDDREENRALLRYLFGPPEFRILEAVDGVEALAVLERETPDCVLLDLELPKVSGLDVLDRMMADPHLRDIPVVIVTATDETAETMERALRTGAVDYITKPISLPRVRARVRGAIERRRLLRDVQRLPAWLPPAAVPGLRTHLEEIATYADLLQHRTHLPEDVRRTYVSRIHQACRQVISRAAKYLDRAEQPADVRAEPVAVGGRTVEELARLFAPGAGGAAATSDGPRDGNPHAALAQARLDQVLRNVLANALTFRATGGRV